MPTNLKILSSAEQLDDLFRRSNSEPVVVFKHSRNCGISAHVLETVGSIDSEINVVVVQDSREISEAIAERTGRRHQSPQAFVLFHETPVYHATHYGIDPEAILRAVDRVADPAANISN